jgi:hypothetical protein
MDPSKKEEKTSKTSGATVSQKVEKKDGPNPSGPGLDSLFMEAKASLISVWENGALRPAAIGGALGYREFRSKDQEVGVTEPRSPEK